MLLYMMVGLITPLDPTIMYVIMCLAGGSMFSIGLGAGCRQVLKKQVLYNDLRQRHIGVALIFNNLLTFQQVCAILYTC